MQAAQLNRGNGGVVLTQARHRPVRAKLRRPARPFQQHVDTGSRKRASQIRAEVRLVADDLMILCQTSATSSGDKSVHGQAQLLCVLSESCYITTLGRLAIVIQQLTYMDHRVALSSMCRAAQPQAGMSPHPAQTLQAQQAARTTASAVQLQSM